MNNDAIALAFWIGLSIGALVGTIITGIFCIIFNEMKYKNDKRKYPRTL